MHQSDEISPLTDENLLVEDGAVWAQKGGLDGLGVGDAGAHMEHLATGLDVSIVAWMQSKLSSNIQ